MRIRVNDEELTVDDGTTVADLVRRFDLAPERVAVEVNQRLVRRATYPETRLHPDDRVEIVTLVGGG